MVVTRRALVVALAGLLFAPCVARAGESRIEPFATRWLEHELGRRPDVAVRLGAPWVHGVGTRAAGLTSADTAWIAPLERDLRALEPAKLTTDESFDRDLLLARLVEDRLDLTRERRFERDPGLPLRPLAAAIRATLEDPSRSPAERAGRAADWLLTVPEALRGATSALREPGTDEVTDAIAEARTFARVLRAGVSGYTDARAPGPMASLSVADTSAVRALLAFADHLELDILPHATPAPPPDRETVVRRLEAWRSRATPESLLARARREIAGHRAAMENLSTSLTGAPDVPAAIAALDQDLVPADSLTAIAVSVSRAVRAAMVEKKLLPLTRAEPISVERAAWSAPDDPAVRFVMAGAWSHRNRAALRLLVPPADTPSRVSRTALVLDVAAAGVPGRWSAELARRAAPSRLRQALTLEFVDNAWALYAARLATPLVTGADPQALELVWRARECRVLGRAAAQLAIALGADNAAAASELTAAGVPADEARVEARRAAHDPSALGDALVLWRVLDLRAQTGMDGMSTIHDAILRLGIPLSTTAGVTIAGVRESPSW